MKIEPSIESFIVLFESKSAKSFFQHLQDDQDFVFLRNLKNFNEFIKYYIGKDRYYKEVMQLLQLLLEGKSIFKDLSNKDYFLFIHKKMISFAFHSKHFLAYWKKLNKSCSDENVLLHAEYFLAGYYASVEYDLVKMAYHYHNILFHLEKRRNLSNENLSILLKVYGVLSGVYADLAILDRALDYSNRAIKIHNIFRTTDAEMYLHQLIFNLILKLDCKELCTKEVEAYAEMIYLYMDKCVNYSDSYIQNNMYFKLFNLFIDLLLQLGSMDLTKKVFEKYDVFLEQLALGANNESVSEEILDGYRIQKLRYLFLSHQHKLFAEFLNQYEENILGKIKFSRYADGRALFEAALETFRKTGDKIKEKLFLEKALDFEREHTHYLRKFQLDIASVYMDSVKKERNVRIEKEKNKVLKLHNDELQDLAFFIAHELKEPFDSIFSLLKLIKNKKISQEQREQFEETLEMVSKQGGLAINNLFKYAKEHRFNQLELVNLYEIIHIIGENIGGIIGSSNSKIIVDDDFPLFRVGRTAIIIVLQNLFINAIRYSRQDVSPVITLSFVKENRFKCILLRDNGRGLSKELQDYINHGSIIKRNLNQIGLGLFLCKRVLKDAGGKLEILSTHELGSVWKISLPG